MRTRIRKTTLKSGKENTMKEINKVLRKEKTCEICKRKILSKDNYCRLTDYNKGEFFMEKFYHTSCFNNQINRTNPEQTKMKRAAMSMLQRANKMLNKFDDGGKPEEVYEIN